MTARVIIVVVVLVCGAFAVRAVGQGEPVPLARPFWAFPANLGSMERAQYPARTDRPARSRVQQLPVSHLHPSRERAHADRAVRRLLRVAEPGRRHPFPDQLPAWWRLVHRQAGQDRARVAAFCAVRGEQVRDQQWPRTASRPLLVPPKRRPHRDQRLSWPGLPGPGCPHAPPHRRSNHSRDRADSG